MPVNSGIFIFQTYRLNLEVATILRSMALFVANRAALVAIRFDAHKSTQQYPKALDRTWSSLIHIVDHD